MLLAGLIGLPQLAALVVLLQRVAEDLYSQRNMRRLLAEGGHEEGRAYYPVIVVVQLAWLAAVFLLIPTNAPVVWPALIAYLCLQPVRYWIVASLGRFWTHRIVVVDGMQRVASGPYRYLRHPNYVVAELETLLLPLAFGQVMLALVAGVAYGAAIVWKTVLEERALAAATGQGAASP